MSSAQILLVAAIIVWMIVRRFAGAPVGSRSLTVPVIMVFYGLSQLHRHLNTADIVLLGIELAVSVAAGLARGYTIKIYLKDGHLWQRYTVVTLAVWVGMVAARFGFAAGAHQFGATMSAGSTILVTFGLSLVIEALVVSRRAVLTGQPIRPVRGRTGRRVAGIR